MTTRLYFALTASALALGFGLDLLLADPAQFPHPVVWMGRAITALEKALRRRFPATPAGERAAGTLLAVLLPLGSAGLSVLALWLAGRALGAGGFLALETLWCWQCLALRGLAKESRNVRRALERSLPEARRAVGRIVGRDTARLDETGVVKAAVETVAENLSDGVVSPLFYLALGGAPLGLAYKAINTMDSMIGYTTERYLWFGRTAARLDDAANWLPSRLAALLLIAAAFLTGENGPAAFRIWRRDRRKHASPNSAQTESACAGALEIQLAGDAWYDGEREEKPFLGDAIRPVERDDIRRANRLLYVAGTLAFLLALAVRLALWGAFGGLR